MTPLLLNKGLVNNVITVMSERNDLPNMTDCSLFFTIILRNNNWLGDDKDFACYIRKR
jgi:hypothetical protein